LSSSSARTKKGNSAPAFVLGLGENGYGIVRALRREGVRVVGIYQHANEYGRYSRYCERAFLDPTLADTERCQRLISLASQWGKKPVLYVTSDVDAMFLSRNISCLSDHFSFHWVDPEVTAEVVDKSSITLLSQDLGILTPKTHVTKDGEDIEQSAKGFAFPCLIKPMRSFATRFPSGLKNFVAQSPESLSEFYAKHPGIAGGTIWQEIVEGCDDDVYQCNLLVTSDKEVHSICCVRKIHQYPKSFGHMSFGRTEAIEEIVPDSMRLLKRLGYCGLASFEFRRDPRSGRYYFIEMNPRLPWYNSIFAACGVNFAYFAYLDLTESRRLSQLEKQPRDGLYWYCFSDQLRRFWELGEGRQFIKWLMAARKARSFAWWELADPAPFIARSMTFIVRGFARSLRAVSRALSAK